MEDYLLKLVISGDHSPIQEFPFENNVYEVSLDHQQSKRDLQRSKEEFRPMIIRVHIKNIVCTKKDMVIFV